MSKVGFVDVDPATEDLFFSNVKPGDRFGYSRLTRVVSLFSRRKKAGMSQKSLLPQCSVLWDVLTDEEKIDWSNAANVEKGIYNPIILITDNYCYGSANFGEAIFGKYITQWNINGWRLFIADTCFRIKNDIPGLATPNLFHQSLIGYFYIIAPATEIKIAQYHPRSYWISRKVTGKKGMYEPVEVTEDFALPLTIELNYKSLLTPQGAGSFAKFFATVRSSYQGIDRFTDCEISLDLLTDWKNATATLTNVLGYVIGYTAYFWLYNLRGALWCDNIGLTHSGQNWCRDPLCKDLNQAFTRAFFQIPKHWVSVEMPVGSEFGSIYPT